MFKMILSLFEGGIEQYTSAHMYIVHIHTKGENNCSDGDCGNGSRNGAKKEL